MQQLMLNPEDITDPTTAMNMALVLMAKAFKLNYSILTKNNQRISSNPRNRQIAQPGMNMGQDRQIQMVEGNGCLECNLESGRLECWKSEWAYCCSWDCYQNPNGNVVAARAEGNAIGNNGNQIRCYNYKRLGHLARNCTFDLMDAAADLDEIEEVNADCILMANLQQASTSEEQYTELLEPIPEPYQVQKNDSNVVSEVSSMEQGGGIVDQHSITIEETRAYFESLYNNLAIEVEKSTRSITS
ncbi:retrovirus-related pol polyprotein from transposon TNT 1-94 [Tanacetum coccineum]